MNPLDPSAIMLPQQMSTAGGHTYTTATTATAASTTPGKPATSEDSSVPTIGNVNSASTGIAASEGEAQHNAAASLLQSMRINGLLPSGAGPNPTEGCSTSGDLNNTSSSEAAKVSCHFLPEKTFKSDEQIMLLILPGHLAYSIECILKYLWLFRIGRPRKVIYQHQFSLLFTNHVMSALFFHLL